MKGKRLSAMAMAAMLGVLLVPSSAYAAPVVKFSAPGPSVARHTHGASVSNSSTVKTASKMGEPRPSNAFFVKPRQT